MTKTAFYSAERTFWHAVGLFSLTYPVGKWVQVPNAGGGADTPDSKRRLLNLLSVSGILNDLDCFEGPEVTQQDMLRVHPRKYIDEFKKVSDAGGGELGPYAPFSSGGYDIAALSAGLALNAVDRVVSGKAQNSYALCRPAGHHCLADTPMGFCLLANIPIAIEAAKANHGVERVAVVDWDVHHGNGTQSIYYDRSDVLTISVHQDRCFPPGYSGEEECGEGNGLGYNLNIPLPPGSGHETYLEAFRELVIPKLDQFKPDLIIIASGLDANITDPLARQLAHSETYRELTKMMMDTASRLCEDRLAVIHEGGYSEAYVPFCGLAIMEQLSGIRTEVEDPGLDMYIDMQPRDNFLAFCSQVIAEQRTAANL